MDDDELALGDLGVVNPDRPLPRAVRHRVDMSAEAVAARRAEAARPARPAATNFDAQQMIEVPPMSMHAEAPEWVEAVRHWAPVYDLATLMVDVRWAVHGLIQAGKVGALVAAGGTGKTTLLLILFICIAIGRLFFGCKVSEGTTVLLTNDDTQEDVEAALALVCRAMKLTDTEMLLVSIRVRIVSLQGLEGLKTFTTTAGGTTMATGLDALLVQAVEGIADLVGIALDTLRQFSGGNSNDEQVIKLTIGAATDVAVRTGAFVILPHHTGKQNYRDGIADMYCGSGSAAIADNCRFVLLLQTAKWVDIEDKVQRTGNETGDPLVLTSTRGSLLVRAPDPIYLHRDGFFIGCIAGAVRTWDQMADEKDRAILRAVRQGAQTKNAIYAVVRGKKTATLERIDALEGRGHLTRSSQTGSPRLMVSGTAPAFLTTPNDTLQVVPKGWFPLKDGNRGTTSYHD